MATAVAGILGEPLPPGSVPGAGALLRQQVHAAWHQPRAQPAVSKRQLAVRDPTIRVGRRVTRGGHKQPPGNAFQQ